jgi:hypothetical protein
MVGILHSIMPFTEGSGCVPSFLEKIRNRGFIKVHPFPPCRGAVDTAANMMPSGQEFRPRWGTYRTDIEAIKRSTILAQRVNIGSGQIGVSIEAQVAPTLIIGQKDHHI